MPPLIDIPLIDITTDPGAKPAPTLTRGDRRVIKLVETPLGWGHALWTSPYVVDDPDLREPCRVCVVLVGKGPPKPEPVVMTIPVSYLGACPEDVVEW